MKLNFIFIDILMTTSQLFIMQEITNTMCVKCNVVHNEESEMFYDYFYHGSRDSFYLTCPNCDIKKDEKMQVRSMNTLDTLNLECFIANSSYCGVNHSSKECLDRNVDHQQCKTCPICHLIHDWENEYYDHVDICLRCCICDHIHNDHETYADHVEQCIKCSVCNKFFPDNFEQGNWFICHGDLNKDEVVVCEIKEILEGIHSEEWMNETWGKDEKCEGLSSEE